MRKLCSLLLGIWFLFLAGGVLAADPEVEQLKKMLLQVMEENRRLSQRVSELEKRLAEYEKRKPVATKVRPVEIQNEKKWYHRMEVGLKVAGLVQGLVGVDKKLANIHAHAGREPAGQADMVMRDEDKAYAASAVDLEFSTEFSERDRAYVLLEMGSGKNPDSEVPSFSGIVDEALSMVPVETSDGDVRVSEAWYERHWPLKSGQFRLRFGKIDVTTEVDQNAYANDETAQFMSPAFVNNPAVEWASYSFGMVASYEAKRWSFTLGYEDADSGWDNIFDYPFLVGQLAVSTNLGSRPGNYRFYLWYQGEKHLKWSDLEDYFTRNLEPQNEDPAWGFGVSFDQELAEGVGLFFRYGFRGEDLVGYANYDENGNFDPEATDFSYGFKHAFTGGVSLSGRFWGRAEDELGLALAVFLLDDDYKDYWEKKGIYIRRDGLKIDTAPEYHLEVYYRWQANEHLAFTPDFQYTWNPSGLKDDGFWVFSLRGVWEY